VGRTPIALLGFVRDPGSGKPDRSVCGLVWSAWPLSPDDATRTVAFTGASEFHSVTIGSDGTLYSSSPTTALFAFYPDGREKWRFPLREGRPAAIGRDAIYISDARYQYALDSDDGQEIRPKVDFGALAMGRPTIGGDGTIYVPSHDGRLHALDPSTEPMTVKWLARTGTSAAYTSVVISPDRPIYTCDVQAAPPFGIQALDPVDGTRIGYHTLPENCYSPSIAVDGTIYVGAGKTLFAFDPLLVRERWHKSYDTNVRAFDGVPAIGPEGTIYIGVQNHGVAAIDASSGEETGLFPLGNGIPGIAVGGDGTIYFGTWAGASVIYALTPQMKQLWKLPIALDAGCFSSPAIGADGTVYVGCADGMIHGIQP